MELNGEVAPHVLRGERRRDALLLQERRVDPEREPVERVQRFVHLAPQLPEHRAGLLGVLDEEPARQPELHGERDQVLLGPVVDVPLEPSTFLVLRGHDPLARRLQGGGLLGDPF